MQTAGKHAQRTTCGLCAVGLLLMASGCATMKPEKPQQSIVELNRAVTAVSEELQLLRASEQADSGAAPHIYPIPHKGKLATAITLKWTGPVEPAVQSVAQLVGYEFQVIGASPSNPVLVTVDARQQPAFQILQDVGLQGGDGVGVVVRPEKQLIAVTYDGQLKGSP